MKKILGVEFGSTRIKSVLINEKGEVIASGAHDWENQLENGYWTYSLDMVWAGLQASYSDLLKNYGEKIETLDGIGISAMMHGYLAFDKNDELLVPFRTWRNTTTAKAQAELTRALNFNMPQRWSGTHFYQAVLNGEEHIKDVTFLTTLAGYVHWQLSGKRVLGIGDAAGMFPTIENEYDKGRLEIFNSLLKSHGLQALNVAVLDLLVDAVDAALQRLNGKRHRSVFAFKRRHRAIHDVADRLCKHVQLLRRHAGEGQLPVVHFLRRALQAHGVVGDALKVAHGVQQHVERVAVVLGKRRVAQLDHVRAKIVLVVVDLGFQRADALGDLRIVFLALDQVKRGADGLLRQLRHAAGDHAALFNRERRLREEALVQQQEVADLLFLLVVAHGERRQLLKQTAERQQREGGDHVERRVDDGDARGVGAAFQERKREHRVDRIEHDHEQDRADKVEVQVNQRRAAGVLARADTGEQRRHAGADVLAHDDRQRRRILHCAGYAQRLKNTDRRRRALDDRRQQHARDHAHDRVGEHQQDIREFRHIRQRLHRVAHHVHAAHQHRKAHEDGADIVLLLRLGEHDERHADDRHDRRKAARLEQLDKQAAALKAGQRKNPARDGRTDIRAHDDADSLAQLHDARIDKTNDHDRRRRRRLDDRRHQRTQQHGLDLVLRQLFKDALQLAAGKAGQAVAHDVHAVQEQRQTTDHIQYAENIHIVFTLCCFFHGACPACTRNYRPRLLFILTTCC